MIRRVIPLLAAFGLAVVACDNSADGFETGPVDFGPADLQIIQGFEFTSTVDGVRSAHVMADSTWQWTDSTTVRLFGVQMEVFDSLGFLRANVTSQEAILDMETQAMVATGDAVLRVPADNTLIRSPVLHYTPDRDLIRSDTVTHATIRGEEMTGSCFESDLQISNLRVCRPVGAIPEIFRDTVRGPGSAPGDRAGRDAASTEARR
ncbi:MAG: LPS export ABC transporter periplasmic protein LptC [Longimicrobiales bacterium]|nr:LPS export ABC transporter periplasmic protein LptC [Longimicrobiales bacterium]